MGVELVDKDLRFPIIGGTSPMKILCGFSEDPQQDWALVALHDNQLSNTFYWLFIFFVYTPHSLFCPFWDHLPNELSASKYLL